ncbi:MAG: urea carboxylase-associated family protein [Burkholderiales bacterium]|nr:urea carboxylase-associated family protein [Burkholderiales bacterium]
MNLSSSTLSPLARAAIPAQSTRYSAELILWDELLPGGCHWSGVIRRGNTLRLTDRDGRANVSALLISSACTSERYNMPDTLKAQHTAYLTAGCVCCSDMGRVLCSIPEDTCGWHDTVCGLLDDERLAAQYGQRSFQDARNGMFRSARSGLLIELGKWGLDERELTPNLNLFSKVAPDDAGRLRFATAHRRPGQHVDLRFEMDTLVLLSAAPHPLDPSPTWQPGDVGLMLWRSGTAGADDPCRLRCAENDRALLLTERHYL